MSEISLDLGALFEKTFGYKTQAFAPNFNLPGGEGSATGNSFVQFGAFGTDYYADDMYGREYFMPVKIVYPDDGFSPTGSADLVPGDGNPGNQDSGGRFKEYSLPYPVISISSRKTIIETPMTERRGTVKELINIQDYEIIIKGFLIGRPNEFPENQIITLRTIYEQNAALSIKCPLTDIFLLRPNRGGSDQVVITELRFPSITGVKNIRPYELRMISDEPFNLITVS